MSDVELTVNYKLNVTTMRPRMFDNDRLHQLEGVDVRKSDLAINGTNRGFG